LERLSDEELAQLEALLVAQAAIEEERREDEALH
jgi:hypothetical protein